MDCRCAAHGTFNFRNHQTARHFKVDSGKSIILRLHGGRTKTSDRANCKGQLSLTVRGKRRLRRIVSSQRSQTLAQITTNLNDSASFQSLNVLCNARFTVWVSGVADLRKYHCSMLAIGLHVLSGKEITKIGM
ncbi:uncharacterized protein TNCV_2724661 [Trichonephila clavipes]|nr:uncharacterized protein TNCV_2724661 [Trichonephila clavipes]